MSCYYSPTEIKDHMLNTQAALNRLVSFPAKDAGHVDASMSNFINEARAGKYDALTDDEYEELKDACFHKHAIAEADFNVIACKAQELSSMIASFIHRYSYNLAGDISNSLFNVCKSPMLFEHEYDDYRRIAANVGCESDDDADYGDEWEETKNEAIAETLADIADTLESIAETINDDNGIFGNLGLKNSCSYDCDNCDCPDDCENCGDDEYDEDDDDERLQDNVAFSMMIKSVSDVIRTASTIIAEADDKCNEECNCDCSVCNKCKEADPIYENEDNDFYDSDMEYDDTDTEIDYDDFVPDDE